MYGRGGSRRFSRLSPRTPSGYNYVGACRCGTGPHAFYQDAGGRVVHASEAFNRGYAPPPPATKEELEYELQALKDEKASLENRLGEVEKELKKESGK